METNGFRKCDYSFWHTNMDLYYGYHPGEVVEVEHESNKYWLATIKYSFKHLLLLRWIGNYGEFWMDTSLQNSTSNSSTVFDEFTGPKRLFPPGYHLQSQLKSQFILERPSKVLVKPSLYNPVNDPYAEIITVNDLLTHEINIENDAFGNQVSGNSVEPASLALAKCKTKIDYGQEDVDELEAALQNLNELDSGITRTESPSSSDIILDKPNNTPDIRMSSNTSEKKEDPSLDIEENASSRTDGSLEEVNLIAKKVSNKETHENRLEATRLDQEQELCKSLLESAISKGSYVGIEEKSQKIFHLKPKQFFDIGGANHEKVLVPGTLLEIYHSDETDSSLELFHWFAIIIKNIGGRLTLRWFLCDEPRFKQGRLELKTVRSEFIREDDNDQTPNESKDIDKCGPIPKTSTPARDITFCMHFCNPCVHSISYAKSNNRAYKIPSKLRSMIESVIGASQLDWIERAQIDFIFDYRRMNLDKDRPIIDHLLSTVRQMAPRYIDLSFAPDDLDNSREVLISSPKMTKLLKGFVKRELDVDVYEIHSEPVAESGEIIKFVYPYDSSYSILPTSWGKSNQDCLSMNSSRDTSPKPTSQLDSNEVVVEKELDIDQVDSGKLEEKFTKSVHDMEPIDLISDTHIAQATKIQDSKDDMNEPEPSCWTPMIGIQQADSQVTKFHCGIDHKFDSTNIDHGFKIMDQLEVVHPSSNATMCLGRIRKVVYPLLWIQISVDAYTLLPFNSTDIYPDRWCETNNHPLISLLPPRKRLNLSSQPDKKRKRAKNDDDLESEEADSQMPMYEKEHFDLATVNDKQSDIDYILNEKSMYIRIYFNHKCFTGPSLSKGKICSLPQYVGPGPLRLVMEEVVTKVISVAYVPPRILNDLSSRSFEELLIARNMTNTTRMEFKAKYQKRVHREDIPICLNPDDVALYCECICEHLKCCYNLFGPNLYDGDDCPGHCRALTKSNKFMKRATYYREKARLGEFLGDNSGNKKSTNNSNNSSSKTSRARYAGRDSSESTSSSISRSEQLNSRASSAGDEVPTNELKENLVAVEELDNEEDSKDGCTAPNDQDINPSNENGEILDELKEVEPELDKILSQVEHVENNHNIAAQKQSPKWTNESEFSMIDLQEQRPEDWTVDDVAEHLDWCHLAKFKQHMISEGVDGQALLLLDRIAIKEHFQFQPKLEYTQEEVGRFCRFVEYVKNHSEAAIGV